MSLTCFDKYNCCDCGGNDCGCKYCFSCKACESCIETQDDVKCIHKPNGIKQK